MKKAERPGGEEEIYRFETQKKDESINLHLKVIALEYEAKKRELKEMGT